MFKQAQLHHHQYAVVITHLIAEKIGSAIELEHYLHWVRQRECVNRPAMDHSLRSP